MIIVMTDNANSTNILGIYRTDEQVPLGYKVSHVYRDVERYQACWIGYWKWI